MLNFGKRLIGATAEVLSNVLTVATGILVAALLMFSVQGCGDTERVEITATCEPTSESTVLCGGSDDDITIVVEGDDIDLSDTACRMDGSDLLVCSGPVDLDLVVNVDVEIENDIDVEVIIEDSVGNKKTKKGRKCPQGANNGNGNGSEGCSPSDNGNDDEGGNGAE